MAAHGTPPRSRVLHMQTLTNIDRWAQGLTTVKEDGRRNFLI